MGSELLSVALLLRLSCCIFSRSPKHTSELKYLNHNLQETLRFVNENCIVRKLLLFYKIDLHTLNKKVLKKHF